MLADSGVDPAEWAAKLEDRFYNNHAFKATGVPRVYYMIHYYHQIYKSFFSLSMCFYNYIFVVIFPSQQSIPEKEAGTEVTMSK